MIIIVKDVRNTSQKDSLKSVGGKMKKISFNKYVKRIGNSLAITIPYHICQEINLSEDIKIKCTLEIIENEKERK